PLGPRQTGSIRIVPPKDVCAWKKGFDDIWMQHGVWGVDLDGQPRLLLPDYFSRREGKLVDFAQDYLRPFINRFGKGIREVHPEATIFIEGEAEHTVSAFKWTDDDIDNIVYAPHWYDGLTLLLKRYFPFLGFDVHTLRPVVGAANIDNSFARQMTTIRNYARQYLNEAPTVIGETGIPFDLNNKTAYMTGNYHAQEQAMNRTMKALEASRVNFTLWNYTADNSHEYGDLWNGEDLSIFSPDDRHNPADINSGGRALKTVIRPYARASAGRPLRYSYDIETGCFEYVFRHDDDMTEPTDFYIPSYQYPQGYRVKISDGRYEMHPETQTLLYYHTERDIPHFIKVTPNPVRKTEKGTFETFWLPRLLSAGGIFLVLWVYLNRKNNHDEETIENGDE
ncbi:MAG: cellulase family glycosylhydrolase, partial [Aggregatilineales bacterium]